MALREKVLMKKSGVVKTPDGDVIIRRLTVAQVMELGNREVPKGEMFYHQFAMAVIDTDGEPMFASWEQVRDADYEEIEPFLGEYNRLNATSAEQAEKN